MYSSFFGFKENPFNLTPDPRYFFLSPYHKEALNHSLNGINKRKGFIVIIGGVGTGKTTLCRTLLNHLDKSTKSALIFNTFISDKELLKTVNEEFGIEMDHPAKTKKDYIVALNRFLLENFRQGGNAVLILDEAQNLSEAALEQVQMLSDLETEREKLIQIVLVGQSELKDLLVAQSLRQLNERVMVRYNLKPLDSKDIRGYVQHRLMVAGGSGNLKFTGGAFKQIYRHSQGNPRRINAFSDRALLIAYVKENYEISKGIIKKAIQEIYGNTKSETRVWYWPCRRLGFFPLLLLLLIIISSLVGRNLKQYISKENSVSVITKKIKTLPLEILQPEKVSISISPLEKRKIEHIKVNDLRPVKPVFNNSAFQDGEPTAENAPDGDENLSLKRMLFSVQVGAFLAKRNAEKLVDDLKRKRYEPYILETPDHKNKIWYSVRIKDCAELNEAHHIAADYRDKERKPAFVTMFDSLDPVTSS
ncbi:AAA family ATPase [bacterium]|nr:AAA family ATPase [bacterium]